MRKGLPHMCGIMFSRIRLGLENELSNKFDANVFKNSVGK